jgi:hypothetical protein
MIHDVNGQWFLGALAKLQKDTISIAMSVHLHGVTWLPLDGFP